MSFYELDPKFTDPKRLKREREKAKALRKTSWWKQKLDLGICYYCEKKFKAEELTLDHIVPLARGGESTKNNIVSACRPCNQSKKLQTPAELILKK